MDAIWHFSSKLYAHALHQMSTLATASESTGSFSSFILSYRTNWQTRVFVGARQSEVAEESSTEVFAKVAYAL